MIISRSFLLGIRDFLDKSYRERIKTHILCSIVFFLNHAIYEKKWKNIVVAGRPQMVMCHMHISCWVPKDTDTHIM